MVSFCGGYRVYGSLRARGRLQGEESAYGFWEVDRLPCRGYTAAGSGRRVYLIQRGAQVGKVRVEDRLIGYFIPPKHGFCDYSCMQLLSGVPRRWCPKC